MIKTGIVLFVNKKKKPYGTIKTDDDMVFFFDFAATKDKLDSGDRVSFSFKKGEVEGKLSAFNVKRIE